jgi:ADP-ribosylglycohydrolase
MDPGYLKDPEGVALKIWLKSNRNAAPNGSLMRTHPLGVMCVGRDLEETFSVATAVGRVTHVDPRCVVSCCLATGLVRGILRGEVICEADVDALIEKAYNWVDAKEELNNPESRTMEADCEVPATGAGARESRLDREEYKKHCHAQSLQDLQLDDSQKMGYVYKCLGSAILTLRLAMRRESELNLSSTSVFESLVTQLILEGGDADTNACVAGALLGAWVGYSRLPPHWRDGIRSSEWLLRKAQGVSLRVGILRPPGGKGIQRPENDPDTALDGGRGMLSKEQLDRRESELVMMILEKQKTRREAEEKQEKARTGTGLRKWLK